MKKIIFILLVLSTSFLYAKKNDPSNAILKILTYNQQGELLHSGYGFFVSENGNILSDYSLFNNAYKAIAFDNEGKQHLITRILGANKLYDLIKVSINKKTKDFLTIAQIPIPQKSKAYYLPYQTQKHKKLECEVLQLDSFLFDTHNYTYYTTNIKNNEDNISCPLLNEKDEVVALLQKNTNNQKGMCAISAQMGNKLEIKVLSLLQEDLKSIHIFKAIPTKEDDALSYLYMLLQNAKTDSVTAQTALGDFIQEHPKNPEGYSLLANFYCSYNNQELSRKNLEKALDLSDKKHQIYYSYAKTIYAKLLQTKDSLKQQELIHKTIETVNAAIEVKSSPLYLQLLGNCQYFLKDYKSAFNTFQEINKSNFATAETFYTASQALKKLNGENDSILALLDSAVACFKEPLTKAAAPYILRRANYYQKLKKYREAVLDYNQYELLVGFNNLNDNFYYLRQQLEMKCSMYKQAIDDINRAIFLNSKEPIYHLELAATMLRINELDKAITAANKALELDKNSADAYKILGLAWGEKGDKKKALLLLDKATELGDTSAENFKKRYQ